MRLKLDEILAKGSASFRRANAGPAGILQADAGNKAGSNRVVAAKASDPSVKRDAAPALEQISGAQARELGSAAQRPHVGIFLHRTKLLDPDSKTASVKPLLDGLVAAGLIPNDREEDIVLQVEQEKVPASREGTGIVITYPANVKK